MRALRISRSVQAAAAAVLAVLCAFAAPADDAAPVQTAFASPSVTPPPVPVLSVFGSRSFVRGRPETIKQWASFAPRYRAEEAAIDACLADASACPNVAARSWSQMMATLRTQDPRTQVEMLNRFVNRLRHHVADSDIWGRSDYWATPFEFLARNGDCEDFAILKYVSLRHLGFADAALRLAVVMDESRDLGHAILLVAMADGETLVLDNVYDEILPDDEIPFYAPQYSVNFTTRYAHVPVLRAAKPRPARVAAASVSQATMPAEPAPAALAPEPAVTPIAFKAGTTVALR